MSSDSDNDRDFPPQSVFRSLLYSGTPDTFEIPSIQSTSQQQETPNGGDTGPTEDHSHVEIIIPPSSSRLPSVLPSLQDDTLKRGDILTSADLQRDDYVPPLISTALETQYPFIFSKPPRRFGPLSSKEKPKGTPSKKKSGKGSRKQRRDTTESHNHGMRTPGHNHGFSFDSMDVARHRRRRHRDPYHSLRVPPVMLTPVAPSSTDTEDDFGDSLPFLTPIPSSTPTSRFHTMSRTHSINADATSTAVGTTTATATTAPIPSRQASGPVHHGDESQPPQHQLEHRQKQDGDDGHGDKPPSPLPDASSMALQDLGFADYEDESLYTYGQKNRVIAHLYGLPYRTYHRLPFDMGHEHEDAKCVRPSPSYPGPGSTGGADSGVQPSSTTDHRSTQARRRVKPPSSLKGLTFFANLMRSARVHQQRFDDEELMIQQHFIQLEQERQIGTPLPSPTQDPPILPPSYTSAQPLTESTPLLFPSATTAATASQPLGLVHHLSSSRYDLLRSNTEDIEMSYPIFRRADDPPEPLTPLSSSSSTMDWALERVGSYWRRIVPIFHKIWHTIVTLWVYITIFFSTLHCKQAGYINPLYRFILQCIYIILVMFTIHLHTNHPYSFLNLFDNAPVLDILTREVGDDPVHTNVMLTHTVPASVFTFPEYSHIPMVTLPWDPTADADNRDRGMDLTHLGNLGEDSALLLSQRTVFEPITRFIEEHGEKFIKPLSRKKQRRLREHSPLAIFRNTPRHGETQWYRIHSFPHLADTIGVILNEIYTLFTTDNAPAPVPWESSGPDGAQSTLQDRTSPDTGHGNKTAADSSGPSTQQEQHQIPSPETDTGIVADVIRTITDLYRKATQRDGLIDDDQLHIAPTPTTPTLPAQMLSGVRAPEVLISLKLSPISHITHVVAKDYRRLINSISFYTEILFHAIDSHRRRDNSSQDANTVNTLCKVCSKLRKSFPTTKHMHRDTVGLLEVYVKETETATTKRIKKMAKQLHHGDDDENTIGSDENTSEFIPMVNPHYLLRVMRNLDAKHPTTKSKSSADDVDPQNAAIYPRGASSPHAADDNELYMQNKLRYPHCGYLSRETLLFYSSPHTADTPGQGQHTLHSTGQPYVVSPSPRVSLPSLCALPSDHRLVKAWQNTMTHGVGTSYGGSISKSSQDKDAPRDIKSRIRGKSDELPLFTCAPCHLLISITSLPDDQQQHHQQQQQRQDDSTTSTSPATPTELTSLANTKRKYHHQLLQETRLSSPFLLHNPTTDRFVSTKGDDKTPSALMSPLMARIASARPLSLSAEQLTEILLSTPTLSSLQAHTDLYSHWCKHQIFLVFLRGGTLADSYLGVYSPPTTCLDADHSQGPAVVYEGKTSSGNGSSVQLPTRSRGRNKKKGKDRSSIEKKNPQSTAAGFFSTSSQPPSQPQPQEPSPNTHAHSSDRLIGGLLSLHGLHDMHQHPPISAKPQPPPQEETTTASSFSFLRPRPYAIPSAFLLAFRAVHSKEFLVYSSLLLLAVVVVSIEVYCRCQRFRRYLRYHQQYDPAARARDRQRTEYERQMLSRITSTSTRARSQTLHSLHPRGSLQQHRQQHPHQQQYGSLDGGESSLPHGLSPTHLTVVASPTPVAAPTAAPSPLITVSPDTHVIVENIDDDDTFSHDDNIVTLIDTDVPSAHHDTTSALSVYSDGGLSRSSLLSVSDFMTMERLNRQRLGEAPHHTGHRDDEDIDDLEHCQVCLVDADCSECADSGPHRSDECSVCDQCESHQCDNASTCSLSGKSVCSQCHEDKASTMPVPDPDSLSSPPVGSVVDVLSQSTTRNDQSFGIQQDDPQTHHGPSIQPALPSATTTSTTATLDALPKDLLQYSYQHHDGYEPISPKDHRTSERPRRPRKTQKLKRRLHKIKSLPHHEHSHGHSHHHHHHHHAHRHHHHHHHHHDHHHHRHRRTKKRDDDPFRTHDYIPIERRPQHPKHRKEFAPLILFFTQDVLLACTAILYIIHILLQQYHRGFVWFLRIVYNIATFTAPIMLFAFYTFVPFRNTVFLRALYQNLPIFLQALYIFLFPLAGAILFSWVVFRWSSPTQFATLEVSSTAMFSVLLGDNLLDTFKAVHPFFPILSRIFFYLFIFAFTMFFHRFTICLVQMITMTTVSSGIHLYIHHSEKELHHKIHPLPGTTKKQEI